MRNIVHSDVSTFFKIRNRLLMLEEKNFFSKAVHNILARRMYAILRRYNSCIPLEAKIGKNIILPHGLMGIFVSKQAEIGDDCTIHQNVTIGSITTESKKGGGAPKLGRNVFVGANAVICGCVTIGDNVMVGAGTTVVEDIPAGATVVGQKPRIILK